MAEQTWLSTSEFADGAGISRRKATRALSRASLGMPWRGVRLTVRVVEGRGGRSGIRYEVALSSLSEELQRALSDVQEPPKEPIRYVPAPNQGARIERRWRIIEDALQYPEGSPERIYEKERAARKWGVSARSIERWIERLELAGGDVNALAHSKPADAGRQRAYVSRAFDKAYLAAGYPAETLPELGDLATGIIQSFWQSPVQRAGWYRVRRESLTSLEHECRGRGIELPRSAFALSRRRIEEFRYHQIVDIRAHDRKRYDDMKPRIRRTTACSCRWSRSSWT